MTGVTGWLTPDAFLDATGRDDLRAPYVPRGGEDALVDALERDPRRLVVLVGEPGAGTSRLALELARRAPFALYPDPLGNPRVDDLRVTSTDARPVVVLDGPSLDDALRPLDALLTHRLHPRLLVLLPIDATNAPRVPVLAGGYPRASILVVSVEPHDSAELMVDDALLPYALLGRVARGHSPAEAALRSRRLVSSPIDGEVVCLAGERMRRAVVSRADAASVRSAIAGVQNHREAMITLARYGEGEIDEELLEVLRPRRARELPVPAELAERAIVLSSRVLDRIAAWAEELLPRAEDGDDAAIVLEVLARDASRRGEDALAIERLEAAERRADDPTRRARLRDALAVATGEANALGPDEARERALRAAERADARGAVGVAAGERMQAAAIARETDRLDEAVALALRARDDRAAIGDARGAIRAALLVVSLYVESARRDDARAVAGPALALAEGIGDGTSIGYLRWVLGAIADGEADPEAAAAHYTRAIAAYHEGGAPVPERLIDSLRAARATSGANRSSDGDEPTADAAEDSQREALVTLRLRPRPA